MKLVVTIVLIVMFSMWVRVLASGKESCEKQDCQNCPFPRCERKGE